MDTDGCRLTSGAPVILLWGGGAHTGRGELAATCAQGPARRACAFPRLVWTGWLSPWLLKP